MPASSLVRIAGTVLLVACASTADPPGNTGAAPVAQVQVAPAAPALIIGDSVQLTATTRDSTGALLTGRTVTWSTSNALLATVSATGMVKGIAVGGVTITATSETITGTANVAVAAAAGGVNECASPQPGWIWCDDFEVDRASSYFEVDNAGGNFVRVAGVGHGGSFGYRARFTVGAVSVGALHLAIGKTPQAYMDPVDAGTALYREIYYRLYVRRQPGWTGGGGNKLSRVFVFASTTTFAQAMIAHNWAGTPPNADYLYIDPARGTDANGNLVTTTYNDFPNLTFLGAVKGTTPMFSDGTAGTWYCVEHHVKLNDAGVANGISEFWINGGATPEVSRTNLNFLGNFSTYALNAVYFENYWNAGSPAVQDRFFDRIVVSTQRIGC